MQKITPFLWFDGRAEEAANFYVSIFDNASLNSVNHLSPDGSMAMTNFALRGVEFLGFDGGPMYKFSEATSFMIHCETQDEVDHYWNRLSEGGAIQQCGWLKDKFGVSWQVIPTILNQLMSDPEKAPKVVQAFMKMTKFVIADLEAAANI